MLAHLFAGEHNFLSSSSMRAGMAWPGWGGAISVPVTNLRLARAPSHHQMPAPGGGGPGHGTLSDARPWPRYLDLALTGRRSRRLRYSQSRSQVHSGERDWTLETRRIQLRSEDLRFSVTSGECGREHYTPGPLMSQDPSSH